MGRDVGESRDRPGSPALEAGADIVTVMARKIITQLVDDLDGTVLEAGEGETVQFAVDGKAYEIDLSPSNADGLRDALVVYIEAARRTGARSARGTASAPRRARSRLDDIRAWARENGITISDRGRIPATVEAAYNAR